jgi:Icc-related predicted phosphoesterase
MLTAPLRILAFSDLHGRAMKKASMLIDDVRPDWIVLCGDILPDFSMISGKGNRLDAQRSFWSVYRSNFVRDYAVTTLVRGNHEIEGFSDPGLRGLPSQVQDHVVRLEGIPLEFGGWGWSREWEDEKLEEEFQGQLRECPSPRIYLSHVPPFGCLDRTVSGECIGHRHLVRHLAEQGWPEAMVLCGHVHEGFGMIQRGATVIANISCGYALLEYHSGAVTLVRMERL